MGKIITRRRALILCIVLTLLWMCMIFFFSAADSTKSANMSGSLLRKLLSGFVPHWQERSADIQQQIIDSLHTVFRKLGHFSEYALLGCLLSAGVRLWPQKSRLPLPKTELWLPALLSFLYAGTDELHQAFVPGRSCELRDMFIDLSGACVGIAVLSCILMLRRKLRRRRSKQNHYHQTGDSC
ncbi:MAG: VanZ family protein [Oscillospiraceae bacterium]|nr:VanZ family protein [Oscillospiraceae bacterium]